MTVFKLTLSLLVCWTIADDARDARRIRRLQGGG